MPDKGIDPVLMASRFVVDVQGVISREKDPMEFGVVTVGAFNSGSAGNIIPGHADLSFNFRYNTEQDAEALKQQVEALRELIDTGVDAEEVAKIRDTVTATCGVLDVHELRTRRMAHRVLVDAHVRVDPRISVSEGHRIAELARARVRSAHPDVLDVLVHVDSEEDMADTGGRGLPGRPALVAELAEILGAEVPQAAPAVLHYLGNRVEAEVFLPFDWCADRARLDALRRHVAQRVATSPHWRRIELLGRFAP